jgi:hypothetical protein
MDGEQPQDGGAPSAAQQCCGDGDRGRLQDEELRVVLKR